MSRFSFNCTNGCGACGVKLSEFETYRSETLAGVLIERRAEPQILSTCCGSAVDVWDEDAHDVTHTVTARKRT